MTAQHRLERNVPIDLPVLHVDGDRIAQVLTNLVGNAVKFSPPHTTITVTAGRAGDEVQVDVSDQGRGISPAERRRIFEPFQQLDADSHHTQGAGLGLAICKGLIEAHGGLGIPVQDRSGPGTTMSFTLPIDPAAPGRQ